MDSVHTTQTTRRPEYAIARVGDDCSVCFEAFSLSDPRKVVTTECQHPYHENCIIPWVNLRGNCPLCRHKVEVRNLKTESIFSGTNTENGLIVACRHGDLDVIEEHYANDASIFSRNQWSNSHGEAMPLILIATQSNQPEVVRLILRLCPSAISQCSDNGTSALITAAKLGEISLARQLLESGADINHRDKEGYSPLHMAVYKGHSHFIDFLLDNHAIIDILDQHCRPPLMLACWRGHMDIVQMLIARGCNLNQQTRHDQISALTYALEQGQLAIARLLIEKNITVNHWDLFSLARRTDSSDLFISVLNRLKATSSAKNFLQIINGEAFENISPLRDCAKNGTADNVDALLKHQANAEVRGSLGHTAIYLAAVNGHLPVVERLLKHGADTNVILHSGLPMLLATIDAGHTNVATALAKHPETDIHQAYEGRTPVTKCVITQQEVNMELLETLLTREAQIDIGDIQPLAYAILKHPTDVIQILINHLGKEKMNNPVLSPAETKKLISELADSVAWSHSYYHQLKREDPSGIRPLSLAILFNKPEAVKMLVGAGAHVTETDLQLSSHGENREMTSYLQTLCHDSATHAEETYTPVATAIMHELPGEDVISKLTTTKNGKLLVNDAVVTSVPAKKLVTTMLPFTQKRKEYLDNFAKNDCKGMRPVTLAILFQNRQIVESLTEAGAFLSANDYRLAILVNKETMPQLLYPKLAEHIKKRVAKWVW